jgi:hypothetical protein
MTDVPTAVFETQLAGLKARGKVRDIYDLGDRLMIVASDRISAFDVVMNEPVPGKGELLTQMLASGSKRCRRVSRIILTTSWTRRAVRGVTSATCRSFAGGRWS